MFNELIGSSVAALFRGEIDFLGGTLGPCETRGAGERKPVLSSACSGEHGIKISGVSSSSRSLYARRAEIALSSFVERPGRSS